MIDFYESDPITSFNFVLRVDLAYDIALKSVRAFTKNNEYEKIQQGGLNDYVIMKRKPVSEPFTLQVERYASDALTDPLANGAELLTPVFLYTLKNYKGASDDEIGKLYMFTGCIVTGKEYGGLEADKPGLMTEIITISYQQMFVIPNIFGI